MPNKFSEYVSLGVNCEGAFQIKRVLGRNSASFFSWNVTPLPALESLIRTRFENILMLENIISAENNSSLIHNSSHDYKFHSPFDRREFREDPDFEKKFQDHKQKVVYLITKFLRPREPDESTVYFYKVDGPENRTEVRKLVASVRDLLAEIHGNSLFALVVLQDMKQQEPQWDDEFIYNRYLKRLSPWSDATDGHVMSWDRVFREFPHVEPMMLAGY